MNRQIQIKLPLKQLDGNLVAVTVQLGTTKPILVVGARFTAPARLILCDSLSTQQTILNTTYQMMQPEPVGTLFHLSSNIIWNRFDFTAPPKPDQRIYFRYPQKWAPVKLYSLTGSLHGVVEARAGNEKHKATISIVLEVQ
jgi:hypothetical protein